MTRGSIITYSAQTIRPNTVQEARVDKLEQVVLLETGKGKSDRKE